MLVYENTQPLNIIFCKLLVNSFPDHKVKIPEKELYQGIVKFMGIGLCITIGPFKNLESRTQIIAIFKICFNPYIPKNTIIFLKIIET